MIFRPNRFLGIAVVLLTALAVARGALPHFKVHDFGAAGDGATDDTAAIQRAIDAAAAAGGGLVEFTNGTYFLNTAHPSSQPDFFYNLIMGSNVRLKGAGGTKLMQGPGGRHPVPAGSREVHNTVLAVGPDYAVIRFQKPELNGGFFPLEPTAESNSVVMLSTPSDSSKFSAGDYVAIYNSTNGGVIPAEINQVKAVKTSIGGLELWDALARSFARPVIANVAKLATTNIAIFNLTIQGAEPLSVTETVHFMAKYNEFIIDTLPGSSDARGLRLKTLRDFQFGKNIFLSFGGMPANIELAQQSSQDGSYEGNTFIGRSVAFGEYASHITLASNSFDIAADASVSAGIAIGGKDIVFLGNEVSGGCVAPVPGAGAMLTDSSGPDEDAAYVAGVRIALNTFNVQTDGQACLIIRGKDTTITGNKIAVTGSAAGIRLDGPQPQSCRILGNTIFTGSGDGVVVVNNFATNEYSIVTKNAIIGKGTNGIFITGPGGANQTGVTVVSNSISDFTNEVARLQPKP